MESIELRKTAVACKAIGQLSGAITGFACGLAADLTITKLVFNGAKAAHVAAKGKNPAILGVGLIGIGAGAIGWFVGEKISDFISGGVIEFCDNVSKAMMQKADERDAEAKAKGNTKPSSHEPCIRIEPFVSFVPTEPGKAFGDATKYTPMCGTVARAAISREEEYGNEANAGGRIPGHTYKSGLGCGDGIDPRPREVRRRDKKGQRRSGSNKRR